MIVQEIRKKEEGEEMDPKKTYSEEDSHLNLS